MSGLDNLSMRLQYKGGFKQHGRMVEGKLKSLKKALMYSYQTETIQLDDGRQFQSLINRSRLTEDFDQKMISIPFEDICLNSNEIKGKTKDGIEKIGMKIGDIFYWIRTDTYWLVYLQYLEEEAYFRAEIRRCTDEIEVNGKSYKAYIRGPRNTDIKWHTKQNISWNDMDFDIVCYTPANDDLLQDLHRFQRVIIQDKPWEVQTVDSISLPGILQIRIKETFRNTIEEKGIEETEQKEEEQIQPIISSDPYINGDKIVYPYEQKRYVIENADGGIWELDNTKKAIITYQTEHYVDITIITGRSGEINLKYKRDGQDDIIQNIQIKSL